MSNLHNKHLNNSHSNNNHNNNRRTRLAPLPLSLPLPLRGLHPTRLRRFKTNNNRKVRRCQTSHQLAQLERQRRAESCGRCSPAFQLHEVDEVVAVAVLTSRIHLVSSNKHRPRRPSNNNRSAVLDSHEAVEDVEASRAEVDTRTPKLKTRRRDKRRDKRAQGGAH